MTANELRAKVAELRQKGLAVVRAAEAENREVTADEQAVLDDYDKQCASLENRAATIEKAEQAVAAATVPTERQGVPITAVEPVAGQAEGDKRRSFGDYLRCIGMLADSQVGMADKRWASEQLTNLYRSEYRAWNTPNRSAETRDMSSTTGASGGYLIPTEFYRTIMSHAAETAIVRPRARVLPMMGFEIEFPILNQTTAPTAGNTAYFGGVTARWTADNATKPEAEPTFKIAKLTAHELSGLTEVPRSLVQKSVVSVEAMLYAMFGGAVAWYEDYALLRGNGVGKPLGVLNAAATITTAARGSATAITYANARKVWVRMLTQSRTNAVWLASQAAEEVVLDMQGTANSVFVPAGYYITGSGNAAGLPVSYTLLGRPVVITEKLPALNSLGDFGCYDFNHYVVGDPASMELAASEHFKFGTNQIVYRFIHRVGGMPWMDSPITLSDASTTVSPFVMLNVQ